MQPDMLPVKKTLLSPNGHPLACFLREFTRGRRRDVILACLVAFVLALTNGISLLLLIPMLQMCGIGSAETAEHSAGQLLNEAFRVFGVTPSLHAVVAVFLASSAVQAVLLYYKSVLDGWLTHQFCQNIRVRLYTALNFATWQAQSGTRLADLAHALSSEVERIQKGAIGLLNFGGTVLFVAAMAAVSIVVAPAMSLLAAIGCVVLWPMLLYPNRLTKQAAVQLTQKSRAFYREVVDQLGGLKESKVLNAEQRHIVNFDGLAQDIRDTGMKQQRALGITNCVFSFGAAVSLCVLLYAGTTLLETPVVELLVLIAIFARLIPRLRLTQTYYQQVLHALPAFETVSQYWHQFENAVETHTETGIVPTLYNSLDVKGVFFRYPGAQTDALSDVSLTIPSRKMTALVGLSGSGKSTLADLLLGLLVPQSGQVSIDDVPLGSANAGAWRTMVGYVPQDPFLLHDTIRANLVWSQPDASDADIAKALRMAAADSIVDALPHGIETIVGDRGVNLSGGERQRITLARALLRKPSVLILDEATSALDGENQEKIMSSLKSLHGAVTIIMIAHRMSTVREADKIVLLHHGRVSVSDQFETLMEQSDQFRALMSESTLRAAS